MSCATAGNPTQAPSSLEQVFHTCGILPHGGNGLLKAAGTMYGNANPSLSQFFTCSGNEEVYPGICQAMCFGSNKNDHSADVLCHTACDAHRPSANGSHSKQWPRANSVFPETWAIQNLNCPTGCYETAGFKARSLNSVS